MTQREGRRLRVCFVVPSLAGGGAERVAVEVLNALSDLRWDRSMFLFERSGPFLADVSSTVHLASAASPSRFGRWRALRRFLRGTRPDVVVGFLSYWSVLTAVRTSGVGARVILAIGTPVGSFLEDADYQWSRPLRRRIFGGVMRVSCAFADRIIATSRGVADELVASFGGRSARIRVVPNPVDVVALAAAAREPIDHADDARWRRPVIVAAGRLADAKNYPLLIEAFAIVRRRIEATLFILGRGDQEPAIRALIEARQLTGSVHLSGFRRNPWCYMARADVFALTSRYEGFGNVLVEAMACGVPVVATSSPGTIEIVTSGADGLLVDRHDPEDFAAALGRLLEDAALRRTMGETARRHADRYRTDTIAAEYERVLTEAVA